MQESKASNALPRCLIVCPLPPYPPDNGWTLRHGQLIDGLSERYACDLVALCPDGEGASPQMTRQLQQRFGVHTVELISYSKAARPIRAFKALWRRHPLTVENYHVPQLHHWLREQTGRVEYAYVLLLGDLSTAQYANAIRAQRLVWDLCDDVVLFSQRRSSITSNLYHKLYFRLYTGKLQRYVRRIAQGFSSILVIAQKDGKALEAQFSGEIITVPSYVDLEQFHPRDRVYCREPRQLLFLGVAKYFPNKDAIRYFSRDILPRIHAQAPEAIFRVIGKGTDTMSIKAPGVSLEGFAADLTVAYREADIFVCPLRTGTGIKNKLLEALASGCPIVTTSIGVEGIDLRDGEEALLADTPEDFASAVLRLWHDPDLRARLGRNARKFAEAHFSRQHTEEKLRSAFPEP